MCGVLTKGANFARDGRSEPCMQPSRNLQVVVGHRALCKGLRRSAALNLHCDPVFATVQWPLVTGDGEVKSI